MSYHILASGPTTDALQSITRVLQQHDQFQVSVVNTAESKSFPSEMEEFDLLLQIEGITEETSLNPVKTAREGGFNGPVIYMLKPENFSLQWMTKLTSSGVTQVAFHEQESLDALAEQIEDAIHEYESNPGDSAYTLQRHQTALEAYRASIRATAHAINNFLTTINGRVQIAQFSYLQEEDLPAEKVRHDINQIGAAATRIQALVTVMQGLTELNQAWHNADNAQIDVQQLIEEQIEKIKQTEL